MIYFYRTGDCKWCGSIQDALEEMVLAHEVILVNKGEKLPEGLPEGSKPPVLLDDKEVIQGSDNILKHLEKLKKFKALWEKFQTDACYCDEEGNVE
jgi:glutathione S-transferase